MRKWWRIKTVCLPRGRGETKSFGFLRRSWNAQKNFLKNLWGRWLNEKIYVTLPPNGCPADAGIHSDIDGIEPLGQMGNVFLRPSRLRKDVYGRYLLTSNLANLNFTGRCGNGMSTLGVLYPHHRSGVSYNISWRGFFALLIPVKGNARAWCRDKQVQTPTSFLFPK